MNGVSSVSAPEKIRVVEALDRLGVHYIEAGFPDSNPKDLELFELLASVRSTSMTLPTQASPAFMTWTILLWGFRPE